MNSNRVPLGVDTCLLSALGHAADDFDRFLLACEQFTERNYEAVKNWFDEEFQFLSVNDRDDAMQEFFLVLSSRLRNEIPQSRINIFKADSRFGKLSFFRYLRVTAKNFAKDFARREVVRKNRILNLRASPLAKRTFFLVEETISKELDSLLFDVKKSSGITDRDWQIFTYSLCHSTSEVVTEFNLTTGAIYTVKSRVYKKLQNIQGSIIDKHGHVESFVLSYAHLLSDLSSEFDHSYRTIKFPNCSRRSQ